MQKDGGANFYALASMVFGNSMKLVEIFERLRSTARKIALGFL
ncbi:hypothetical protein [Comamonas thiooxydans]|nr:hypothetical protein [Comamonas thiooxydans]